jgi:hypothetical protein
MTTRPGGDARAFTRDAWVHRIDIARAAGLAPELTPGHDGRIVADIVAEWSRRHGQPYNRFLCLAVSYSLV